jgi:O-antigen ligase
MSRTAPPAPIVKTRREPRFDRDVWVPRLRNLAIAIVVGLVLGQQIYNPQPRIMKGLIGMAVLYAGWRFPIPVSLSAFLILFPFPFVITYGSSNTIFVFLITAMWMAQIVLRTTRPVGRTLLDLPILLLMAAYLVSFGTVSHPMALAMGLGNVSTILAGVFVYYIIVNSVRDEATLRRMVNILIITANLTFVVGLYELIFPGKPFIKGWILSQSSYLASDHIVGVRVGGPFGDFELYAEYTAMMFPIMVFMLTRAQGMRARVFWGGITLLNLFILMATVTRGATISLFVGMCYLLYRLRRAMTFRQTLFSVSLGALVMFLLDFYLSHYTVSGSIFGRLINTKFIDGMPDSRTFWPQIIERIQQRPWTGHGPYYEFGEFGREKLTKFFWPHNGYLYYLHTVGIFGTSAFLWIVGRLWFDSKRRSVGTLTSSNYPRSLLLVWHIVLTIFLVDQLKIEYLRNQHYQFFPWIVFGLMVATLNVIGRQTPGTGKPAGPAPKTPLIPGRGPGQSTLPAG